MKTRQSAFGLITGRRLTRPSRLMDELVQEWRGLYPRGSGQKALMPF